MKRFNLIALFFVLTLLFLGFLSFNKKGYHSNNSIMLARNMTIASTIEGHVINNLPKIGDRVKKGELLVKLINNRIDKSRLVDYKSQMQFIQSEIKSTKEQLKKLEALYLDYKKRASDYANWMVKDTKLANEAHKKQLLEAERNNEIKNSAAVRLNQLYKNHHASNTMQQTANAEALIAETQVDIAQTQLIRSELLLHLMERKGVIVDDGEASYWEKMRDDITLKKIGVSVKLASLNAALTKLALQEEAEQSRVDSSFTENILAPFSGIISSKYINNKTSVTSGTNLLQILDCSNPVVIIPIPEHRLGDFHVGMEVTVNPLDSEYKLKGRIDFISSGPLIASDKTMFLQQDMTINGNKAIVSLENSDSYFDNDETCDISRKAVAIIHT